MISEVLPLPEMPLTKVHSPRRKRRLRRRQERQGVVASMRQLEIAHGKPEYRILAAVAKFRASGQAVELARPLHVFDRLGKSGHPPGIGLEGRDVGHDMDEPRALADQRVDQLGAGHIVLQADMVVDVGQRLGP